jgi:hypothetical protein
MKSVKVTDWVHDTVALIVRYLVVDARVGAREVSVHDCVLPDATHVTL